MRGRYGEVGEVRMEAVPARGAAIYIDEGHRVVRV